VFLKIFRLVLFTIAANFAFSAMAQDCSKGFVSGKVRKAVADGRYSAALNLGDQADRRLQLDTLLSKEKSCVGQNALRYVIAMIDVNQGELDAAIAALPVILQSDMEESWKAVSVQRLIGRLYQSGATGDAIILARGASERFKETPSFPHALALLLAADGQIAEARLIAQSALDSSLSATPKGLVSEAGWIRFAIAGASGDQEDFDAVLASLSLQAGESRDAILAYIGEDVTVPVLLAARVGGPLLGAPNTPPQPRYPQKMAVEGRAGDCNIHFDVSVDGVPQKVQAVCEEDGFKSESERAVSEARYDPLIVDEQVHRRIGMTYPLEFKLQ
tara:strand:- start:152 stop:1144 length:993 start_codon:yes stop_codon:yes gene_type:complete